MECPLLLAKGVAAQAKESMQASKQTRRLERTSTLQLLDPCLRCGCAVLHSASKAARAATAPASATAAATTAAAAAPATAATAATLGSMDNANAKHAPTATLHEELARAPFRAVEKRQPKSWHCESSTHTRTHAHAHTNTHDESHTRGSQIIYAEDKERDGLKSRDVITQGLSIFGVCVADLHRLWQRRGEGPARPRCREA
jgi:hypothetical protein